MARVSAWNGVVRICSSADVERAASAKPGDLKAPRLQKACARGAARAQDVRAPANISENPVRRGLPWAECLSTAGAYVDGSRRTWRGGGTQVSTLSNEFCYSE